MTKVFVICAVCQLFLPLVRAGGCPDTTRVVPPVGADTLKRTCDTLVRRDTVRAGALGTIVKVTEVVEIVEAEEADVVYPAKGPSHFSFRGLAIDGSRTEFGKGLEGLGYRRLSASSYTGSFAGVDGVQVFPSEAVGNIWKVSVLLPAQMTWMGAKEQYLQFKNRFGYKYVVSPSVVREHLSAKYREGSGMEMWGFENGSSVYYSSFEFHDGRILLYIVYDKPSGGMRVCVDYVDRINSLKKEDRDMEDL